MGLAFCTPTMNGVAFRNLILLVGGNSISYFGDIVFMMALNVWILRATSQPELVGAVTAVGTFATFLFNPIGGYLADRFDRRLLFVASDILSALAVLILILTYSLNHLPLPVVILVNALLSVAFAIYSPCTRALGPQLVPDDQLRPLNSALSISNEVIRVGAPAVGGFLLNWAQSGIELVLWINFFSFLVSAGMGLMLVPSPTKAVVVTTFSKILVSYRETWRSMDDARTVIIITAIVNFFAAGLMVVLPVITGGRSGTSVGFYATAMLAQAIGALIGGFVTSRLKRELTVKELKISILSLGAILVPAAFFPKPEVVIGCIAFYGAALSIFNINIITLVQKKTPREFIGRAFGLFFTVSTVLAPIGNLIFSRIEGFSPGHSMPGIALGLIATSLVVAIYSSKEEKHDQRSPLSKQAR